MGVLFQALAFLTRIPVPSRPFSEAAWQKSVVFYPLVGGIIGIILWTIASVLPVLLSIELSGALLLVVWVFLTGGLHLDGWMDLADGVGSNRSPERMLEIMKDSRVGAMGVLAAVLLLIVKLISIGDIVRLNHPVWLIGKGVSRLSLSLNFIFVCSLVWWVDRIAGLIVLALSLLAGIGWTHWIHRKLGGLTGDCYGATVEWTEVVVLIMTLLVGRFV